MFDFDHAQLMEGDLSHRLASLQDDISHIRFAGVPASRRPHDGEVHYANVFAYIDSPGWNKPLGAKCKPDGSREETLTWMRAR